MPIEVLLIEDSPGDVRLTQEAFRNANSDVHLNVVVDGAEAIAFLRRQGTHITAPRPDLVLLDLNLPKMDGFEVLARIKADDSLKLIPTIVLTTSDAAADIERSYQMRANCYLTKPVQLDEFEDLVKSINSLWLTSVRSPQKQTARRPTHGGSGFLNSGVTVLNQPDRIISGAGAGVHSAGGAGAAIGTISAAAPPVEFAYLLANKQAPQTDSTLVGPAARGTAARAADVLSYHDVSTADNNLEKFKTLELQAGGSRDSVDDSTMAATNRYGGDSAVIDNLATAVSVGASVVATIKGGDMSTLSGGSVAIDSGATNSQAYLSIAGADARAAIGENPSYAEAVGDGAGSTTSIASGDALTWEGISTLAGLGTFDLASPDAARVAGAQLAMSDWLISASGTILTLDEALNYAGDLGERASPNSAPSLNGSSDSLDPTTDGANILDHSRGTFDSAVTVRGAATWTNSSLPTETVGELTLGEVGGATATFSNGSSVSQNIADDTGVGLSASIASRIVNAGPFEKIVAGGTSAIAFADLFSGEAARLTGTAGSLTAYADPDAGALFQPGTVLDFNGNSCGTASLQTLTDSAAHASFYPSGDYGKVNFNPQDHLDGRTIFTLT